MSDRRVGQGGSRNEAVSRVERAALLTNARIGVRRRNTRARLCKRQESNLLKNRFDRTMIAGVAGIWVALAMSGCVNVAQQDTQAPQ